jgi:hypothetical protein
MDLIWIAIVEALEPLRPRHRIVIIVTTFLVLVALLLAPILLSGCATY